MSEATSKLARRGAAWLLAATVALALAACQAQQEPTPPGAEATQVPAVVADDRTPEKPMPEPEQIELPGDNAVPGWKTTGPVATYAREKLSDYINGGAARYLAYQFQVAHVQRYVQGEDLITVEAYGFASSEDAFGVYSEERGGPAPEIQQEANYGDGLLQVWKGRWYVRVTAEAPSDETELALLGLGLLTSQKIAKTGQKPRLLKFLSEQNLRPNSLVYFHQQVTLNHVYFLTEKNSLHLGTDSNAVLGEYVGPGTKSIRILIEYPKADQTKAALADFVKAYFEAEAQGERYVGATELGDHAGVQRQGKYLLLCFEAKTEANVRAILDGMSDHVLKMIEGTGVAPDAG